MEHVKKLIMHVQQRARPRVVEVRRAFGELARALTGAVDGTPRVDPCECEQRQRELDDALRESEARFAQVFRCAPELLAIGRASDSLLLDVNDAFLATSGYRREDVVGRRSADMPWWPSAAERDHVLGKLREQGFLKDEEATLVDAHGRRRTYLVSASPIVMHNEACVVWQAVDVTDRRHADEERRGLEERLRQKQNLEQLGTLAGGIAHDFNNLLASMLGNAELLLTHLEPGSPLRPVADAIATGAQRAAEHTRELLEYAGRGGTQLKPVRLDPLVAEAAALARAHVPVPARLELSLPEDPVWVDADAGQLTRLLVNALKNAAEALDDGAGSIELRLRRERHGERSLACIEVEDTGHGVDEATRARIFEPFFTTKPSARGLGLASAPTIVARHAGELSFESAPGRGSRVVVRLPERSAPSDAESEARPALKSASESQRVLLVDDDPAVRKMTRQLLEVAGFVVEDAASGEEAVSMFERNPSRFALAVLDYTMPGIDGVQTLVRLRELAPSLPAIVYSGYSRTDLSRELSAHPHVRFLGKPFRLEDLQQVASELLMPRHSARAPQLSTSAGK